MFRVVRLDNIFCLVADTIYPPLCFVSLRSSDIISFCGIIDIWDRAIWTSGRAYMSRSLIVWIDYLVYRTCLVFGKRQSNMVWGLWSCRYNSGATVAYSTKDVHTRFAIPPLNHFNGGSPLNFNDSLAKQRFLTPGHQGWNDLHSLCRIGMEYYLLNNDDNNIIYWIMMIIMIMMMIIIMMTMMIIGTATIMIMIIIITTTLTMTIMKTIIIKTAQTPCQSLYKDRRI